MRLTQILYGYTVGAIALTVPTLSVATGDVSTDRNAKRKSPLNGAFFCLKIGKEYGDHCAMRHEGC